MTIEVALRAFREGDAAEVTDLLHRAYAELGAQGLNFTAVDQDEETTLSRASAGACWVVVARGRIVATGTVSLPPHEGLRTLTRHARVSTRAWLNQLAVDPSLRGHGYARLLREQGFAWARGAGATSIGLDTALSADHLVRLYRGWDFTHRDTIQVPGKVYRSVVMTRSL
ncbi:Acetyltransferase (GNAT) family protein [Streptomyces sp. DvalAA-14]|uniref:GNAT family N-acetyltransferase n=1 Tax=unclassified Streptomyces TaxID=2593676 RepID=UPI00081B1C4E|nr:MULTISPECIES: GNAT family N-acetyltransferase [unclassified Streptomyces]MYS22180.1 GNAT family N-acetyltransferase [Streptomyces sp. SID4948]SCE10294.1 Acetyltransferase (GNAT) family protein [Streptomyces sp. DvalAA-14]